MAFIGNQPISAAFLTDTFSGTGSQTAFTMTVAPANTSSIIVAITGVLQDPSTYSVSGTTLTFSAAPPSGTSNISVRYLGIPASGVTTTAYRTVTNTTATAGQTSFTIPSYTVGYVDVYRNGVYLPTSDYTATTGTTVVLNNACTVGDTVTTISFYVSSVLNAIPATAGSVSDSYIVSMAGSKLTGTQVIPKATLPTGSVLQVVNTTTTVAINTTSTSFVTTNFALSITPLSSTSKVFVSVSGGGGYNGGIGQSLWATIYRGATNLGDANYGLERIYAGSSATIAPHSMTVLDSPATTSSTTYTCYFRASAGTVDFSAADRGIISFTAMEIAA